MPLVRTPEEADGRRTCRRDDNPGGDSGPSVQAEHRAEDGHRIRPQAEEGGMAERHQPDIADQDIEAHGEDGEDEDLGDQQSGIAGHDERGGEETSKAISAANRSGASARVAGGIGRGWIVGTAERAGEFDAEQALRTHQEDHQAWTR